MKTTEFQLRAETEAAKVLISELKHMIGNSEAQLLTDMLEGETNLLEAIDAILTEIDETEVLIGGLKEKEGQFTSRRRAMEERVKRLRALIEQAMAASEQDRLRRPAATLTLKKLPPDVVVLAEADIPAQFFIPQPPPPPKLDKTSLREALKQQSEALGTASAIEDPNERENVLAGIEQIPGATLNNGGFSLQIRRA